MSEDLSEEILELCVNVCEKKLSNNQEIAKVYLFKQTKFEFEHKFQ